MGCGEDQSQGEINGSQVGTVPMLPKKNEKQSKHQNYLNESHESDILDGISEKIEETTDRRDLIQPSLSQKNTLSSLKHGGSLFVKSPKQQQDIIKRSQSVNEQFQNNMHTMDVQKMNDSKAVARVLGYTGSENAISDEDETKQYQSQHQNIIPQYQQKEEQVKRSGMNSQNLDHNQYNTNPHNEQTANENYSQQTPQYQDNLESTERFNAQVGSINNLIYQNQKELQQMMSQNEPPYKGNEDNQGISSRATDDIPLYNNVAMQKLLQQKILQDKILINQLKNQNLYNSNTQHQANSPSTAQFQSIQNQLSSHRLQPDSNTSKVMQEQQQNQFMQDQYMQMMNGVCISKRSQSSHQDYSPNEQQQNMQEIQDQPQQNQLASMKNHPDQETFFPSHNQISSYYNSNNPNNYEMNHPHNIQTNNLNNVLQQRHVNPIVNFTGSFGNNDHIKKQNQQKEIEQIMNQQQQIDPQQQERPFNKSSDINQQNKHIQCIPTITQQYQIPKGYDVAHTNALPFDKGNFYSEAMQVRQLGGDRPITADSSRGTEYTVASQKNLSQLSQRGLNPNAQTLNKNNSIPNTKIIQPEQVMMVNNNNPLNVYLMQNSAPIMGGNQKQFSYINPDQSEDVKCNYSQSINEIHPADVEQQQKHYLHQYDKKKKRDLVTDSHLFNSFNNTNFFQTIPNNNSHINTSNLNLSSAAQGVSHTKNPQNRVVNLSTNSEFHEYSKSKTPLNDPSVSQSNHTFQSHILQGTAPFDPNTQGAILIDGDHLPRDSIYSNNTNQGSHQGNMDMSHIIQKVNDIQGKEKEHQIQNNVMLNSLNVQQMNSVNNFNQYGSSNPNNQTGNFDTARSVSQVHLNSLHFHDATLTNIQYNQATTLTTSIDGRKRTEGATPKNMKNGQMISSNPILQTHYTFKQLDTPEAKDLMSIQQQLQSQGFLNSKQTPIQETDRALEQSDLEHTLVNQHNFMLSPSPGETPESGLKQGNQMISHYLRRETDDEGVPDDEQIHYKNDINIDIDPIYKLSPKAKSQSNQTNNQIYNQNAQKNLMNSYQSFANPMTSQSQQQPFQYINQQMVDPIHFQHNEGQYISQNSSRQTSPFNKPTLHLQRSQQLSTPGQVDTSPQYTESVSQSQISNHNYNFREEQTKQASKNQPNYNEQDNQQQLHELEKQRIEAALMNNNDEEDEDNQKLIKYMYDTGLMKKNLSPIPQNNSIKFDNASPGEQSNQSNQEYEHEIMDQMDPNYHQNTLQSNGPHSNYQYINGNFNSKAQHQFQKPQSQYENTPNFNSSIVSQSNQNNQNSIRNSAYPVMSPASSQHSLQKEQSPAINQMQNNGFLPPRQISLPTTNDNHPFNIQQNNPLQKQNTVNSLNKYFINPDYSVENPKAMETNPNDPMRLISQNSQVQGHQPQSYKQTENSKNNWSQNNDGTIMFSRDGGEYQPQEQSMNENILFLNSSKALRDKSYLSAHHALENANSPINNNYNNIENSNNRNNNNSNFINQSNMPAEQYNNRVVVVDLDRNSPQKERKTRSPSPINIKMTRTSELKYQVSQERIKQMNDKAQKKKDLVNLRMQEFQKKQEEKESKQDNVVKEQNKQLRIQNLRLKEQNELLKKQMESIVSNNVQSNQSQMSVNVLGVNKQQNDSMPSGRLNSTPHKSTQKSPSKSSQFASKLRSPSFYASQNYQSQLYSSQNSNKNMKFSTNGSQHIPPATVTLQMNHNGNNNSYHQDQGNYHSGESVPQHYQSNEKLNQGRQQNPRGNSPNSNNFQIDISKMLSQVKQPIEEIDPNHIHQSHQGSQRTLKSHYNSQKSQNSQQDHPQLNYSPKNENSLMNNNQLNGSKLSHNPSTQSINQSIHTQQLSQHGSPRHNSQRNISSSTNNLLLAAEQVNLQKFHNQQHPEKLMESLYNNEIGDANYPHNNFQQSSPECQVSANNNKANNNNNNNNNNKHQRSLSSVALNPTKSSINSKPQNQLYDSKNSTGYESLQLQMSDQFNNQKPSFNDISVKSPDSLNKKLTFSSNKKAPQSFNHSTKDSLSGHLNSNLTKSQNQAGPNSLNQDLQNNIFSPKQSPETYNNKNDYLMSAHLDNEKQNQQIKNQQTLKNKVDDQFNKLGSDKYKLVQNIDNTYSLMQKNPKGENPFQTTTKNPFKNNFMPRQYNPNEMKNKNQQQTVSQENSNEIDRESNHSKQRGDESKGPLKIMLGQNQSLQQYPPMVQQNGQKLTSETHRSKNNEQNNPVNVFEKKKSTPQLGLSKTGSTSSLGVRSSRNNPPSANFGEQPQNINNISMQSYASKGSQYNTNQYQSKPPSQTHIRSQSNLLSPSHSHNAETNGNLPQTNQMLNTAMNSIMQKIENCYEDIYQGYEKNTNTHK